MVKVTLVTNNPRKHVMAAESKTVRQILSENEISIQNCSVAIDGFTLGSPAELDKALMEHTSLDTVVISVLANKDNGVQAIVAGSACIFKSSLTPDEIKQIKKLRPEMLTMEDEDGEPVFAIDIDETMPGSINKYGACFGNATSTDGKATITVIIDPEAEDTAQLIEDQFGSALLNLDEMEKALAEELPSLAEEARRVKSMITRL